MLAGASACSFSTRPTTPFVWTNKSCNYTQPNKPGPTTTQKKVYVTSNCFFQYSYLCGQFSGGGHGNKG